MTNPLDFGFYTEDDLHKFGFKNVGSNVRIAKNCLIIGAEHFSFGENCRIDAFTAIIASAPISFGSHIHIGGHCHFAANAPLSFGDYAGASQGVKIYTSNDDYSGQYLVGPCVPPHTRKPTTAAVSIGRFCIIGSGSVVLPGATINEGAVVGALSLVKNDLPAWTMCGGVPAKPLKERKRDCADLI